MVERAYAAMAEGLQEQVEANPASAFGAIVQRVVQWISQNSCDFADQAEPLTRRLFNEFIRPIDLPGVPNLIIEPRVDDALEEAAVRIVLAAVERFCGDDTDDPRIVAD